QAARHAHVERGAWTARARAHGHTTRRMIRRRPSSSRINFHVPPYRQAPASSIPSYVKEKMMKSESFRIGRHWLRTLAPLSLVVCAALAVPALRVAAAAPATVELDIAKFAYTPKEITVAPGTKGVWTNREETRA